MNNLSKKVLTCYLRSTLFNLNRDGARVIHARKFVGVDQLRYYNVILMRKTFFCSVDNNHLYEYIKVRGINMFKCLDYGRCGYTKS